MPQNCKLSSPKLPASILRFAVCQVSEVQLDDTSHAGWKSVDTGDGLLLGSAEGGFCGLEEFSLEEKNSGAEEEQPEGSKTMPARKQGVLGLTILEYSKQCSLADGLFA